MQMYNISSTGDLEDIMQDILCLNQWLAEQERGITVDAEIYDAVMEDLRFSESEYEALSA